MYRETTQFHHLVWSSRSSSLTCSFTATLSITSRIFFVANDSNISIIIYVVILLRSDKPKTFNELLIVVVLFNFVKPDTNNDDVCEVALFNSVKPDTFNDDKHGVELFKVVTPDTSSC